MSCMDYARPSPTDMPYSQRDLINKKEKMKTYLKNLNSFKVSSEKSGNGLNAIPHLLVENEKIRVPFSENVFNEVSKINLEKKKLNRYLELLDMELAKTPATIELDPSKIKAYVKMLGLISKQPKPADLISRSRIKLMKGSNPSISDSNNYLPRNKQQIVETDSKLKSAANSDVINIDNLDTVGLVKKLPLFNFQDNSNDMAEDETENEIRNSVGQNEMLISDYQSQPLRFSGRNLSSFPEGSNTGKETLIKNNPGGSNQNGELHQKFTLLENNLSPNISSPEYSRYRNIDKSLTIPGTSKVQDISFEAIKNVQNFADNAMNQPMANFGIPFLMSSNVPKEIYTDNQEQSVGISYPTENSYPFGEWEAADNPSHGQGLLHPLPITGLNPLHIITASPPVVVNPGIFLFASSSQGQSSTPNYSNIKWNHSIILLNNSTNDDKFNNIAAENMLISLKNTVSVEFSSPYSLEKQLPPDAVHPSSLHLTEHKAFPLKQNDEILSIPKIKYFKCCFSNEDKAAPQIPQKPANMYSDYYLSKLKNIQNYNDNEDFHEFMSRPILPEFGTRGNEVSKIINANLEHLHCDKGALYKIVGKALKVDEEKKGGDWDLPQWLETKYEELVKSSHRGQTITETSENDRNDHYPLFPRCMLTRNGFGLDDHDLVKDKQSLSQKVPLNKENLDDKVKNEKVDMEV